MTAKKTTYFKAFDEGKERVEAGMFTVITIAVIIIIGVVIYRVWKAGKQAATAVGDGLGDAIIAQQTGIPIQRIKLCREVANNLVNNIVTKLFFIDDVDEDAWINELNRLVAGSEANLVSQFFKEQKSKGLRYYVNDAFDASEKARVKPYILTNIY